MAESKKEEKALKRVQEEIKKIENKKSKVFFFVLDTKGNPSGSLEYIYKLAMIAKNDGYDVGMLYQSIDMRIFRTMTFRITMWKSHLLTYCSYQKYFQMS